MGETQGRSLSAFRTGRRLARDGCAGELGERRSGVGGVIRRELEIVARVFDNAAAREQNSALRFVENCS